MEEPKIKHEICMVCKKREATTTAIRFFEANPIMVCDKCYNDMMEEDD